MTVDHPSTFDEMARDLERLRIESGAVSFAEIVARIVDRRLAAGAAPGSAQIARSTVYDVFRPGRSRVNPDLLHEIVLALGGDEAEAGQWRQRCVDARTWQRTPPQSPPSPQVDRAAEERTSAAIVEGAYIERASLLYNPAIIAIVIIACIGLNNIGGQFVAFLDVPLYLDMTGTAVAAVILGPWWGVLVAVLHHGTAAVLNGSPDGLWFALVNVAGALVWGYGLRSWRLGRSASRFIVLNLLAGLVCSVVAVPILIVLFGGMWHHPAQDVLVPALRAVGVGLFESVTSVNLLLSMTDKLLEGYFALAVAYGLLRFGVVRPSGLEFGPFRLGRLGLASDTRTLNRDGFSQPGA